MNIRRRLGEPSHTAPRMGFALWNAAFGGALLRCFILSLKQKYHTAKPAGRTTRAASPAKPTLPLAAAVSPLLAPSWPTAKEPFEGEAEGEGE